MHAQHAKPASFHGSPQEAMQARPEEFLYLACLHEGTGVDAPDFIAVVDAEQGRIVHETPMPNVGDELHHFGWNRCSSACHGPDRSHLTVPGMGSSRIHVLNVADDPRRPQLEKVIEPREVVKATGYTRPHTVHCTPGDNIVISMLGDADGDGAGGFAVVDAKTFEVKGRWENGGPTPSVNYDFWYQPRKNVLSWDNQFYPELRSWLLEIDVGEEGGLEVDPGFFVDFADLADGPARAHEVRFPGGDSTSEVFQ
jgi:methanethiol oxidase